MPGVALRAAAMAAVAVLAVAPSTVGPAAALDSPGAGPGSTGVGTDIDAVLEQVRDELAESSEAMVRAAADLRLAEAALPGAQETARHARELLETARRRQEETARLRGEAQVRLMLSAQDAEQTAAQVDEQRARIGRLARAAYQGGGSMLEVSVLLEARSPADFAERLVSWQTVVSSQRSVLSDLETVEEAYGEQTADLEQIRDTLAAADEKAQAELRAVARLEAKAAEAERRVGRLVAAREAALAAARAAQAADDAAAAQRETVSGALGSELAARARQELGPGAARDGSQVAARPGTLEWPVVGRLSSPFGMRVHPITGVYKLHTGMDLSAPCGTPVRAARPGTVIASGWNTAYGYRVVVSHGAVKGVLLTTTYNHLSAAGLPEGSQVETGGVVGNVGSTGYSTGCHLHFELFVNSSLVDPDGWLPVH